MRADVFLDTNVLLYAISKLPAEASKATVANQLIASTNFGLSVQVCQEFYVAATRKIAQPITPTQALDFLHLLANRPLLPISADLLFRAITLQQRNQLSYWDAAIVVAAQELEATTLYTEDLNNGQMFGDVKVVNPFATALPTVG